jgi:hypothetical protein
MDFVNLPNIMSVVRGFDLRVDAARAISHVEQNKAYGSSIVPAQTLRDFFIACANAADKAADGDGTRVQLVTE